MLDQRYVFALLFLAMPAFGQVPLDSYAGSPLDKQTRIFQYQIALEKAEQESGAYSPELGEILLGLGRVYQEFGEHNEAIRIFKRSAHLTRINVGLISVDQITILEELIESYLLSGKLAEADDARSRLFRVQRKLYAVESQEYKAALQDYVHWQQIAYRFKIGPRTYARLLSIEELEQEAVVFHPQIAIQRFYNCYLIKGYSGEPVAKFQMTINGDGGAPDKNADIDWHRFKIFGKNIYRNGVEILEAYIEQEPDEKRRAYATALLGDWYIWNGKLATAKKHYLEAYAISPELFEIPVQIPPKEIYIEDPYIAQAIEHEVPVIFTVRDTGRLEKVDAPETEDNKSARIRALKDVRKWRYRPRIENGEIVETEDVSAVYHIYQD